MHLSNHFKKYTESAEGIAAVGAWFLLEPYAQWQTEGAVGGGGQNSQLRSSSDETFAVRSRARGLELNVLKRDTALAWKAVQATCSSPTPWHGNYGIFDGVHCEEHCDDWSPQANRLNHCEIFHHGLMSCGKRCVGQRAEERTSSALLAASEPRY